jgi:Periplasmic component of the Tol biopolymer transport system
MQKHHRPLLIFICILLSLSLQGCLSSTNSQYQSVTKGTHGDIKVNVDQAAFQGRLYFTLDRNLYVLDGKDKQHPKQLTHGIQVRDPAISPDGKWIAFTILYKDYDDLAYMPANGGTPKILISGNGSYQPNGSNAPISTAHWFAEPSWAPDSQHIIFLSDLQKNWNIGVDAFLLDLQLYRVDINNASATNAQIIAYAVYGDGGLRDPAYRPGHSDQIIYTNYQYDSSATQQQIQIMLQDANIVQQDLAQNPQNPVYHPGAYALGNYPSVPLTPAAPNLMNLEPAFSPDGNQIIYLRRDDATHMSMYLMSVPNGVTSDPNNPAFDPQSATNRQKALVPYAHATKLMTSQYLSQPIWSPDGSQIAYINYTNQSFDLWLAKITKDPKTGSYSIDTQSEQQLTMTSSGDFDADSRPCWAP